MTQAAEVVSPIDPAIDCTQGQLVRQHGNDTLASLLCRCCSRRVCAKGVHLQHGSKRHRWAGGRGHGHPAAATRCRRHHVCKSTTTAAMPPVQVHHERFGLRQHPVVHFLVPEKRA